MKNAPDLWLPHFPFPKADQHKYDRGHVVVSGGNVECTGAACLAANAALRIGTGLVTVAAPVEALTIYACKLTSVMTKPYERLAEFRRLIDDPRKNVILLGPGNGVTKLTADQVKAALSLKKSCVLDADALTVFARKPRNLFKRIKSTVVLTPHEGEFARLFNVQGDRGAQAVQAAELSNAVIVLKGHHTIIASPDGKLVENHDAPSFLATAGTGDVLAGMIAGLIAQGMPAFDAACAAVWLHGKTAQLIGLGMISEDLPLVLPRVLQSLTK